MNNPEQEKGLNPLEKIKDLANSAANSLKNVSVKKIAIYGSTAVVGAFSANEIASTNQAEARAPIDHGDNMAMVGTVTVQETVTKEDGDKDTTIQISRKAYNPFEERGVESDYVPLGIYTAMGGSKNLTTTKQKDSKLLPLDMEYVLPDAYGCGVPAASKLPFRYNPRDIYNIAGRPSYKKIFGKKRFVVNGLVTTENSTGIDEKDTEIRQSSPNNIPLNKTEKIKKLNVKPTNRTTTRNFNINMDQCYPLSEATNPKYDKHKAAGYEYVPPKLRIQYTGKIKNRKNGRTYQAETSGKFELVDIRIYNQQAYISAR